MNVAALVASSIGLVTMFKTKYRELNRPGSRLSDRALAHTTISISGRTPRCWIGNLNYGGWFELCHNRCVRDLQFDILLQVKASTSQPTQVPAFDPVEATKPNNPMIQFPDGT
ncbi:hypothetical protein JG687_00018646 [Phytophthora cactorum]|uniref:Uncharacterized protein n=1 Tax=Phytophthora cactorum TaxID=29920 RepID=A0A8T1TNZ5_9STRA|nr:hypothetical protein JG687_00018646 [Phytophthora cactorum]